MPVSPVKNKVSKRSGRPNLTALAEAGRIKLDAKGQVIGSPKNNVLYVDKKPIKVAGAVIGYRERQVTGGHVLTEDSVWRLSLGGPSKYHYKRMVEIYRNSVLGKRDKIAPELETQIPVGRESGMSELREYRLFLAFLAAEHAKGVEMFPEEYVLYRSERELLDEFKALDKKFYAWLAEQDVDKVTLSPIVSGAKAFSL